MMDEPDLNPMKHPPEQPSGSNDSPKFGRLLVVLVTAVLIMLGISALSAWYYS